MPELLGLPNLTQGRIESTIALLSFGAPRADRERSGIGAQLNRLFCGRPD